MFVFIVRFFMEDNSTGERKTVFKCYTSDVVVSDFISEYKDFIESIGCYKVLSSSIVDTIPFPDSKSARNFCDGFFYRDFLR